MFAFPFLAIVPVLARRAGGFPVNDVKPVTSNTVDVACITQNFHAIA
jgi:hypothetical protein